MGFEEVSRLSRSLSEPTLLALRRHRNMYPSGLLALCVVGDTPGWHLGDAIKICQGTLKQTDYLRNLLSHLTKGGY